MREWLVIASEVGDTIRTVWLWAGMVIVLNKMFMRLPEKLLRAVRHYYHEVRPFYLFLLLFDVVITALFQPSVPVWLNALSLLVGLFCWRIYRDIDDDDRWKRRKKKLADKVKAIGTRLVVVPAGS